MPKIRGVLLYSPSLKPSSSQPGLVPLLRRLGVDKSRVEVRNAVAVMLGNFVELDGEGLASRPFAVSWRQEFWRGLPAGRKASRKVFRAAIGAGVLQRVRAGRHDMNDPAQCWLSEYAFLPPMRVYGAYDANRLSVVQLRHEVGKQVKHWVDPETKIRYGEDRMLKTSGRHHVLLRPTGEVAARVVRTSQSWLTRYNEFMQGVTVSVRSGDRFRVVQADDLMLKRVFGRCGRPNTDVVRWRDLEGHGRLYCAAQGRERRERETMKFDGCPTCEVDFSTFHPLMACDVLGRPQPEGDFYLAVAPSWLSPAAYHDDAYAHRDLDAEVRALSGNTRSHLRRAASLREIGGKYRRAVLKLSVNTLINCKSLPEGEAAVERKLTEDGIIWPELGHPHIDVRALVAQLASHPLLEGMVCSDMGIRLMRYDSEIAMRVIDLALEAGEPVFPVHDSFRVSISWRDGLKAAMRVAYIEVMTEFGFKPSEPRIH